MCVQYIRGCSVHQGDTMSTSGDIMSTSGEYHEAMWGISWVHWGDNQYMGGYHEYIRGCSVHWGDIMMHVGEQVDKSLSISIEKPDVLNFSRCTHDIPPMYWTSPRCTEHPPMYSWYVSNVLMIFPDVLMVSPRCTHGIPPHASWYFPDVLNIPQCTHNIPWCTHGIPSMYSWYPPDVLNTPMYSWYLPDVLMVSPRCTEHSPMYWTHIVQGGKDPIQFLKSWKYDLLSIVYEKRMCETEGAVFKLFTHEGQQAKADLWRSTSYYNFKNLLCDRKK